MPVHAVDQNRFAVDQQLAFFRFHAAETDFNRGTIGDFIFIFEFDEQIITLGVFAAPGSYFSDRCFDP